VPDRHSLFLSPKTPPRTSSNYPSQAFPATLSVINRLLILPVLILTLLGGTPAFSADWDKGLTAYESGDLETALREFRPLAKQGVAVVQSLLGWMYEKGQGVSQDYKTAVKWYSFAAEQRDADAQYNLCWMYEKG
jgi:hypothetical protein